ncbi:hypothetical protein [Micromonospora sp. NPDC000668]|uniref:hypothetical protein n=1 Tax=Micromonospora sp. NPDC000668 TaxID=3364219 RepID=UPI0036AE4DC9
MAEDVVIKPYKAERLCEPSLDVAQLTFKTVNITESVYTRALIHLQNASLPSGILSEPRRSPSDAAPRWQPTAGVMFLNRPLDPMTIPDIPAGPIVDPLPPPNPNPTPEEPEPQPVLVPYELYVMLRYRQDWTPCGYGIGELLYTTSLMPDEELVLEVKTWETSRVQQDSEDATDQRNVSDIKSTASSASEAATEDQTKTHESVDAKASYSGFGFSASAEVSWSEDVTELQKNIEKRAQERAQQTTNEYRSSHKVRIATSRDSGSESKTTRRIKNINQAHTLNVNYYEVLREFDVEITPYEATLTVLGAEPNLSEWTGYHTWYNQPQPISLGQLIRASQSAAWVAQFIDVYGVSPIKVLRQRWSAPLYDAALVQLEWWGDDGIEIQPQDREDFQRTVLRYVRPTPGWVEPDEKGALRWGYEVVEGKEHDLLAFLYEFLPYSPQQLLARARSNMSTVAAVRAMTGRFARAVVPNFEQLAAPRIAHVSLETPELELADTRTVLVRGPFHGADITDAERWRQQAEAWIQEHVVGELIRLRANLGAPTKQWKSVLPTQGVYADLALGLCSGAEDYIEINRQFDLELKRLEIQRLQLEVEKLHLENGALQAGKPQVLVQTDAETTSVKLDLSLAETPSKVEIKKPGN